MRHLLVVAVLTMVVGLSTANAGDKSPFPDGTYALKSEYCTMTREQALSKYEGAFIDIRGQEVGFYESSCKITEVTESGENVILGMECDAEGDRYFERIVWKKKGRATFIDQGNNVYTACGQTAESPNGGSAGLETKMSADTQTESGPAQASSETHSLTNFAGVELGKTRQEIIGRIPKTTLIRKPKASSQKAIDIWMNMFAGSGGENLEIVIGGRQCGFIKFDKVATFLNMHACYFGKIGSSDRGFAQFVADTYRVQDLGRDMCANDPCWRGQTEKGEPVIILKKMLMVFQPGTDPNPTFGN